MGGAVNGVLDAEAQCEVARVGHGSRHYPEHAHPRRGGALAVHDHLLPAPLLGEGEVVVVLGNERCILSDPACEAIVDHRVVRRGESASQAHREPVFLAFLRRQLEPRELLRLPLQSRATLLGDLRVAGGDLVSYAPTPGVGEKRQVRVTRFERREHPHLLGPEILGHGECAELDEVITAPGGSELHTRRVLEAPEEAGSPPGGVVEDLVRRVPVVAHASTEKRLIFESALELVLLLTQHVGGELEDAKTKSAGDIQANGPGDDGLAHGQHSSNRQPVADMGVGHQGAAGGHRQSQGGLHLWPGGIVDACFAPRVIGQGFGAKLLLRGAGLDRPDAPPLTGKLGHGPVGLTLQRGAGILPDVLQFSEYFVPGEAAGFQSAGGLQSQPDHLPCRPSERQYVLAVDHVASYLTIVVKKTGKARVQWSRRGSNSHAPEDTAHLEAARVPFYHGAVGCRELLLRFVRSQMNRARFELPRKVWETSSPLSYGSVSGCGSGRARTPSLPVRSRPLCPIELRTRKWTIEESNLRLGLVRPLLSR